MTQLVSNRGHFLLGSAPAPHERPTLTVEAYRKWYSLYLLMPDGDHAEIPFSDLEEHVHPDQSAYCDHAPNPIAVQRMAKARGWDVEWMALEMIIGRWETEYHGRYIED